MNKILLIFLFTSGLLLAVEYDGTVEVSSDLTAGGGITWGWQLTANIDGWGIFPASSEHNYLGFSGGGSNGFDASLDIPEPPLGANQNYVSVYFSHPEWSNVYGDNFTQDVKSESPEDLGDDTQCGSDALTNLECNLTEFEALVVSDMAGEASLTFNVKQAAAPANVHTYAEIDGVHHLISDGTTLNFFLSEGTPKLITITIGNIFFQTADNSRSSKSRISLIKFINTDSDGDGYTDIEELKVGTDPNDGFSVIYRGFWPFNLDKERIKDPGFGTCPKANGCGCESSVTCPENSTCTQLNMGKYCVPSKGSRIPRFKGVDQFGDEFDLYDLADANKPILIEIGTTWPQACKDFSAWRSYINEDATTQKWWKNKFKGIRDLIDNGEVYWVHIIHLDENKNPATSETIDSWYWNYPHDNVILLADPEAKMKKWIRPTGYPCVVLVDENMDLQVHTLRGIGDAIDEVYRILGKGY